MLRSMVEEFHVKLEEDNLFPLFEKSGQVDGPREHPARAARGGRTPDRFHSPGDPEQRGQCHTEALARNLMAYARMIQAHTAYEETLLYPQIRSVASDTDYDRLQKTLQDAESQEARSGGRCRPVEQGGGPGEIGGHQGLAQFTPKTEAAIQPTSTR